MDIETMVFISVDVYEWKKHLAHLMTFSDRTKNLSYLTKCYRSERKKRTFLIIGCFHFVFFNDNIYIDMQTGINLEVLR